MAAPEEEAAAADGEAGEGSDEEALKRLEVGEGRRPPERGRGCGHRETEGRDPREGGGGPEGGGRS